MTKIQFKECSFCGSEVSDTFIVHNKNAEMKVPGDLCELCDRTWAANAYLYPGQYDTKTFKQLSMIGNLILQKLSNNPKRG